MGSENSELVLPAGRSSLQPVSDYGSRRDSNTTLELVGRKGSSAGEIANEKPSQLFQNQSQLCPPIQSRIQTFSLAGINASREFRAPSSRAILVRIRSSLNFTATGAGQAVALTARLAQELVHVHQAGAIGAASEPIYSSQTSELGIEVLNSIPLAVTWDVSGVPSTGGLFTCIWLLLN